MNWSLVLAALIIAIAIVVSVKEFSGQAANRAAYSTVANMAATLLAARLRDTEYMKEVESLRRSIEYGESGYPGSAERVREVVEKGELARAMLEQIDYMEESGRQQWVNLAWDIYREVVQLGTDSGPFRPAGLPKLQ